MKQLLCAGLLLLAVSVFAQQQPPAAGPPTGSTPPTFPDQRGSDHPSAPDAPATAGQPTSGEVQQQINQKLSQEPALKNTDVRFDVDDNAVLVSGSVRDEQQHQLALRLAQSYAGKRKIKDFLKVQGAK